MASRSLGQLTRAALPLRHNLGSSTASRSFSLSLPRGAKNDDAPQIRQNPLIGNYIPAKPAAPSPNRDASASTEKPGATAMPHPDKAPVSSAEVAPNADLPPRPPPTANPADTVPPVSAAAKAAASAGGEHAYDAKNSILGSDSFLRIFDKMSMAPEAVSRRDPTEQPRVHTGAVTGRTVHVAQYNSHNGGMGAPRAINILEGLVRAQGIRRKFNYQKFHERKGLKRKRQKSERWQRRFKTGFVATVSRVMELKRQGW